MSCSLEGRKKDTWPEKIFNESRERKENMKIIKIFFLDKMQKVEK